MRNGIDHCAQPDNNSSRYLAGNVFNIHYGGTLKLLLLELKSTRLINPIEFELACRRYHERVVASFRMH